jgi:hypothetical protein
LEPQAKNCAIVMKQKEDADLYISEIEMELNQQADLKSMLEKTLGILQDNSKSHLSSINHCQAILDDVHRKAIREERLKAEAKLRRGKRHLGPGGGGGATPRSKLYQTESSSILMTPKLSEFKKIGDRDHNHTPGSSGHRNCPACDIKRKEVEAEISKKTRKLALVNFSDQEEDKTSAEKGSPRRRKRIERKTAALVNKTQNVAVELSAAIQLLEKSFERWQEIGNERDAKRSGLRGTGGRSRK